MGRQTDDEWAHNALRKLINRALIDAWTVLMWMDEAALDRQDFEE